jgi:hypothetical protein
MIPVCLTDSLFDFSSFSRSLTDSQLISGYNPTAKATPNGKKGSITSRE